MYAATYDPIPGIEREEARPNIRTIWRACPECLFETGWPKMQPSAPICPYCGAYFQPVRPWRQFLNGCWRLVAMASIAAAAAGAVYVFLRIVT